MLFWGWSPKNDKQFFTLSEMIQEFDISGINKNDPVVDLKKIDFFNAYYIRQKTNDSLLELLYPYMSNDEKQEKKDKLIAIISLIKDRMKKLSDWTDLSRNFFHPPHKNKVKENLLSLNIDDVFKILGQIYEVLKSEISWKDNATWQAVLRKIADEFKISHGDLFMILRIAVWGEKITPPLYETMKVIGINESLVRIKQVLI